MNKEETRQCKSKGCCNPVLKGKYCQFCKKKRKEKRAKVFAVVGSTTILGIGGAAKKGAMKQIPKIAEKVVKVIIRA